MGTGKAIVLIAMFLLAALLLAAPVAKVVPHGFTPTVISPIQTPVQIEIFLPVIVRDMR